MKKSCKFSTSLLLTFLSLTSFISGEAKETSQETPANALYGGGGWAEAQIKKDFMPYEEQGITLDMLDQTMAWNAKWRNVAYQALNEGMVRYRVIDSQVYQTHHQIFAQDYGVVGLRVLEEMIKKYPVPDIDFIYFDQDGPLPSALSPDGSIPFLAPDGSVPLAPILAGSKRDSYQNIILYHDWISHIKPRRDDLFSLSYSWAYAIESIEEGVKDHPWETKVSKLFWRGRPSDRLYTEQDYLESPRVGMVLLSKKYPDLMDIAFTGWWNNFFLSTKKELRPLQPFVSMQDHLRYKYQVAVDGYAAQFPGFAWRLLSNCLVFKIKSPVKLWFDAGLIPGFHYLEVENDLSDLLDKIIWAQEHDDEARRIAENGRTFVQENIMPDDMLSYCYKVLLKYASLQRFQPIDPTLSAGSEFTLVSSPLTEEERSVRREFLKKNQSTLFKHLFKESGNEN